MDNVVEWIGKNYMAIVVSFRRGRLLLLPIIVEWFTIPVAFTTLFHPTDAILIVYKIEGKDVPGYAYWHQILAGELSAIAAVVVLFALLLASMTVFYKRLGFSIPLWPLCLVLVGFFGNCAWWFGTGGWDTWGAICGFVPVMFLVAVQYVSEKMGKAFIFGLDVRPEYAS